MKIEASRVLWLAALALATSCRTLPPRLTRVFPVNLANNISTLALSRDGDRIVLGSPVHTV